ncbi:MAG: ThiF family adenylyltransferase [Acidimicrobiales bacterium]
MDILAGFDIVIDGADNFPSRYVLNGASVKLGIPVVHGSIFRFEGQITVFDPKSGPTYRDLLPEPPPPELRRAAPKPVLLVCFRALSGRSRHSRPSRSFSGSATPWLVACSRSMPSR